MTERAKSLIFAGAEPVSLGIQPDECLPLHISLAPSFEHAASAPELDELMEECAASVPEFQVRGGSEAQFGSQGEYRVRKILPHRSLVGLHWQLLSILHELHPDLNMEYSAIRYNPHVSYKESLGVDEHEIVPITHIYRAQKALGQKCMTKVVAAYPLK